MRYRRLTSGTAAVLIYSGDIETAKTDQRDGIYSSNAYDYNIDCTRFKI